MSRGRRKWCELLVACSAVLGVAAGFPRSGRALPSDGARVLVQAAGNESVEASMEPELERRAHRLYTRGDHALDRLGATLGDIGIFWLDVALSVTAFFAVASVASVVDVRMFDVRHRKPGELSRYLGSGLVMFFSILVDRRTPYLARFVLGAALVYWLLPFDFIPDNTVMPGFVDDVIIAASAAKGFLYLCPDSLVERHASGLESKVHA